MTLTDTIKNKRRDVQEAHKYVEEARERLWAANAADPERQHGESDEHWRNRQQRDKERVKRRKAVVNHLVKKLENLEKELEDLVKHKKEIKEEHAEHASSFDPHGTRIVSFDGHSVVELAAYWCDKARKDGKWHGYVISGYRTPAYSQQLCYNMCGAPSCPGRCAGTTSNHTKTSYPGPAVDVSDWGNFGNAMASYGYPLENHLPLDPPHWSQSGY